MIEIGQHVKCLLKNNSVVEGTVMEWEDTHVKLEALDHSSILIIHHPQEDIILTKIVLDDDVADDYKEPAETPIRTDLEEEFDQAYNQPSGNDLRTKRLAELRIEMANHEKKMVREKLRHHHLGEVKKVEYGTPGFLKKPSTQQHSSPQTTSGIGCHKQRPVDD